MTLAAAGAATGLGNGLATSPVRRLEPVRAGRGALVGPRRSGETTEHGDPCLRRIEERAVGLRHRAQIRGMCAPAVCCWALWYAANTPASIEPQRCCRARRRATDGDSGAAVVCGVGSAGSGGRGVPVGLPWWSRCWAAASSVQIARRIRPVVVRSVDRDRELRLPDVVRVGHVAVLLPQRRRDPCRRRLPRVDRGRRRTRTDRRGSSCRAERRDDRRPSRMSPMRPVSTDDGPTSTNVRTPLSYIASIDSTNRTGRASCRASRARIAATSSPGYGPADSFECTGSDGVVERRRRRGTRRRTRSPR